MTTIVYKDGIMAADTRAYTGHREPIGQKTKIQRLDDGTLIGASSTIPGAGEAVIQWWKGGRKEGATLPDSFTMLAVDSEGRGFYASDKPFVSGPLTAPYFAIGSGSEYAQGAMEAGVGAVDAVRIACRLDVWSALPIVVSDHKKIWTVTR